MSIRVRETMAEGEATTRPQQSDLHPSSDDARIAAFVERDYARVVSAVTAVCGDRGRAEDAVQEALARAWLRLRRIESLAPWVTRVAMNHAHDVGRRTGAERRALMRAMSRPGRDTTAAGEAAVDEPTMEAVARLSRRQREVVVLHYFLDQSVDDVAVTLGISAGSVKTLLHRARGALRTELVAQEADEP